MTVLYRTGNLLTQSDLQVIAHQTNCRGAMGAGLAKQLRAAYPAIYPPYQQLCRTLGAGLLGHFQAVSTTGRAAALDQLDVHTASELTVVNLFGQLGWGYGERQTSYPHLGAALTRLHQAAAGAGVRTIGVPAFLGCGLAGGDWGQVEAMLHTEFATDPNVRLVIVSLR